MILCLISIAVVAFLVYKYFFSDNKKEIKIYKSDWKENVVYLYQFPPAKQLPNLSPFCVKLESWLRMNEIKYELISTLIKRSKEGTLPFIELNGQQYHDSTFIIEKLSEIFDKKQKLSPEQRGISRAIQQMVECSLFLTSAYVKFVMFTDQFMSKNVTGINIPEFVIALLKPYSRYEINRRVKAAGIGRHDEHEIIQIGLNDLKALSDILGAKPYFLGETVSEVDAAVFGQLACTFYLPIQTPHAKLMRADCHNLVDFLERFKNQYWTDWNKRLAP